MILIQQEKFRGGKGRYEYNVSQTLLPLTDKNNLSNFLQSRLNQNNLVRDKK